MSQPIPLRSKLLVLTAVTASLLEIIDTSIVNVAVPTMMGNLGATIDEISWVITGYIIANAIVLPIAGWMGEQFGRKRYYTGCVLLFTASSVACGLAPNLATLTIFRVVQGFAGGALLPTSQALIYESFPKEKAGMASAIFGMSVMIGPTIGPTLGGYLTDNFGWRSIFNINLPLGIVVAILSVLLVEDVGFDPNQKAELRVKKKRTPVDAVGLGLLVLGLGCLQFVLERGHADDWFDSNAIVVCTILAVLGLSTLIWWELRNPHPILQLRHFKNATFRSGIFLMFGLGCMLYGLIFLIPVFVSVVQGLTATQTGELFIPGSLAAAAIMPIIGSQLRKRDPRVFIAIGVTTLSIGVLMIARFDSDTSVDGMFWPLLIRGLAMAFLFVPINTTVLTQFTGAAIGEAAGMLNLCRQLGGSIGIASLSTLFQRFQSQAYSSIQAHVTYFDPAGYSQFISTQRALVRKFVTDVGIGTPATESLKLLFYRAQKQAYILGFQKVLVCGAVLFLAITVIPIFIMRPPKNLGGPLPDAH